MTAASCAFKLAHVVSPQSAVVGMPLVSCHLTRAQMFAVFGDFGLTNDESIDDLIKGAASGAYDSILHVGRCS